MEIEDHIRSLGPYDFQKLVAKLLVGMGYYVPFVVPPPSEVGVSSGRFRVCLLGDRRGRRRHFGDDLSGLLCLVHSTPEHATNPDGPDYGTHKDQ